MAGTPNETLLEIQAIQLKILTHISEICESEKVNYWLDGGSLLGAVRHNGFIPWDDDIDIVMPRADFQRFIKAAKEKLSHELELELTTESALDKCYSVPCKVRHKKSRIIKTHPDSKDDLGKGIFIDIIVLDYYHDNNLKNIFRLTIKKLYRSLIKIKDADESGTFKIYKHTHNLLSKLAPILNVESPVKYFHSIIIKHVIRIATKRQLSSIGYGFDSFWIRIFKCGDIFPLSTASFEGKEFNIPKNPDSILKVFYGNDYMTLPKPCERQPKHIRAIIFDIEADPNIKIPTFSPQENINEHANSNCNF